MFNETVQFVIQYFVIFFKAPIVESLEKQMHDLLKQRAQRWVERRQEDVKDQSDEFLALQTGTYTHVEKNLLFKGYNRPFRGYCTTTSASTACNYSLESDYSQW